MPAVTLDGMFGIRGLDPFGLVHAAFGMASVVLGLGVVLLRKGTLLHRRVGLLYAASMFLLNVTALAIYDLFGGFGPFHALALVSLATTGAGVAHAWLQRPRATWMEMHARWMSWSYAGVVAAFVAEIATRLPGVDFLAGVLVPTALITAGAGILIHRSVPRTLAHLTGQRS
jgi:uncharacterized membrane protein